MKREVGAELEVEIADKFYGFAATEFGSYVDSTTLLERVSLWVGTQAR